MAIGQKLCIPSVQLQTAIYSYSLRQREIEDHSFEGSVGLAKTCHRSPPLLEIRRGRWRVAFTLDGLIEKGSHG